MSTSMLFVGPLLYWYLCGTTYCLVSAVDEMTDCTMRSPPCTLQNWTGIGECNMTTGVCSCDESSLEGCFSLNESNNYCVENTCFSYQEKEGTCRNGTRSKTITILLSVFLINFGAANFYIERYELAISQIILGLALILFQFGSCAVAGTRDGETTPPCIICCSINTFLSLLFLCWWISDLVIFATNMRPDRQDCPLY